MEKEAGENLLTRDVAIARSWRSLLLVRGRPAEAAAELARAGPLDHWPAYVGDVVRALLAAHRGDRRAATDAARRACAIALTGPPLHRYYAAADVVPALVRVGAIEDAAEVLDDARDTVDAVYPAGAGAYLRARLLALGAVVAAARGDETAADSGLAGAIAEAGDAAAHLLRREWDGLAPLVSAALVRGTLRPEPVMALLASAFPDGLALVPFADHPDPVVRRAAVGPAFGSGHPDAARRLAELRDDPDPGVASTARAVAARIAADPPPRMFRLLGGFSVHRGAWPVEDHEWGRPAAARLVRFLLVRGPAPIREEALLQAFWPELSPAGARRSLQVAASRARLVLDQPGAQESVLEVSNGGYRLKLGERDIVDSHDFEAAATAALEAPEPDVRLLEHARSAWGGEPLPEERYADWAAPWRQRLVDLHVDVLGALAGAYERTGDHDSAVRAAQDMAALDPLDEAAHRLLIARVWSRGCPRR